MIGGPEELAEKLAATGYLPGEGLTAAAYLALRLGRPLFLEGAPGVGKTDFARKLAQALGIAYIRLQCHSGLDASQALYEWNFPQQILTLRAIDDRDERAEMVDRLYTPKYLLRRPIMRALQDGPRSPRCRASPRPSTSPPPWSLASSTGSTRRRSALPSARS